MSHSVARQRARSTPSSAVIKRNDTFVRSDVKLVEIDQRASRRNTMRIMASRASRLFIDDVPAVKLKAVRLIAQNRCAAMTFVTERVIRRALGSVIIRDKLALQQWCKSRSMRSIGSGPAGTRPRVAIMTVRAIDQARWL